MSAGCVSRACTVAAGILHVLAGPPGLQGAGSVISDSDAMMDFFSRTDIQ